MSYSAVAVRWAALASRARRALSERMASTARAWDWASRNARNVPRPGSKRSGWFHRRKEHLLGHVLGLRLVVEDASGQAVDGPAVTAVHLGQGHLAVAGNSGDELGITDIADLLHLLLVRNDTGRRMFREVGSEVHDEGVAPHLDTRI